MPTLIARGGTRWIAAASISVSACGGGGGSGGETAQAQDTVVFHVTGMVLVVPPNFWVRASDIVMPYVPDHEARLGVGIAPNQQPAGLCDDSGFPDPPSPKGFCYVNLSSWEVEPFGEGGEPSPPEGDLPAGLLNVTRLAGGSHKVRLAGREQPIIAHIRFHSGAPGPYPCALAEWLLSGDETRTPRALVNVLEWRIVIPSTRQLVFTHKHTRKRHAVPLPPPYEGEIELILAHIPVEDLDQLPPRRDTTAAHTAMQVPPPKLAPDSARDFRAYYGVLHRHSEISTANRQIPFDPDSINPTCDVAITPPLPGMLPERAAPNTYSCMLATATRN